MMDKKDFMPAFPTESEGQTGTTTWRYEGMTLRDYFAAKAMQAVISKHGGYEDDLCSKSAVRSFSEDAPNVDEAAIYAYAQADAMMKARNAA